MFLPRTRLLCPVHGKGGVVIVLEMVGLLINVSLSGIQDEVADAQPEIDKRTEQLVSKGRWGVPGYKVNDPSHHIR